MNYSDLAKQLTDNLQRLFRCKNQKQITDSLHGEAYIMKLQKAANFDYLSIMIALTAIM